MADIFNVDIGFKLKEPLTEEERAAIVENIKNHIAIERNVGTPGFVKIEYMRTTADTGDIPWSYISGDPDPSGEHISGKPAA